MIYLSYGDGKTTVGLDRLIKEGITSVIVMININQNDPIAI